MFILTSLHSFVHLNSSKNTLELSIIFKENYLVSL